MELLQLEVKAIFLHGELDKEIYTRQPEGFEVIGKEDYVCRLERSLYHLKQKICRTIQRPTRGNQKLKIWLLVSSLSYILRNQTERGAQSFSFW